MDENQMVLEKKRCLTEAYAGEKAVARQLVKSGQCERAFRQIEFLGSISWHYPILKEFIDDDLELMLTELSKQILKPTVLEPMQSLKRVVFYNGQIIDTGALTEQYLNYLIANDYEVLFIVQDRQNAVLGRGILQRLSIEVKTSVLILESGSKVEKIRQLHRAVIDFNPDFSFLHFLPNDVVGYAAFSQIAGRPRYYIVHNDHTFWLGKACSDYFLEFRQIGVKRSLTCRDISKSKLVNLPYYPIHSQMDFQGFPFDRGGKVVGFSGALLSKYFRDPNLTYFERIVDLIKAHPSFVFCLCGRGTVEQVCAIKGFVEKHGIQDQFYYLGHRSDFYSLVGEIDILFLSYPQGGGLVALFATNQGKAVVGVGSRHSNPGTIEQYLDVADYRQPLSFDEFEEEAGRLIADGEYRNENALKFSSTKYNRKSFDAKLSEVLQAGFAYQDSFKFYHNLNLSGEDSYDFYYNSGQSAKEFLCRAKCNAFIDRAVFRRFADAFITIRFKGVRHLVKRLQKKISSV